MDDIHPLSLHYVEVVLGSIKNTIVFLAIEPSEGARGNLPVVRLSLVYVQRIAVMLPSSLGCINALWQ